MLDAWKFLFQIPIYPLDEVVQVVPPSGSSVFKGTGILNEAKSDIPSCLYQ